MKWLREENDWELVKPNGLKLLTLTPRLLKHTPGHILTKAENRRGGQRGGVVRRNNLSQDARIASAKKACHARWSKYYAAKNQSYTPPTETNPPSTGGQGASGSSEGRG